jgi:hypothetical protein
VRSVVVLVPRWPLAWPGWVVALTSAGFMLLVDAVLALKLYTFRRFTRDFRNHKPDQVSIAIDSTLAV